MTAPVEAQSLSSLSHLFSNPPNYPRNPTHQVHEPLVLYIVRVPGSKDVFLTPLKPPTKDSISLEAIQSSLYYLHVATPDDEEVRSSIEQETIPEEPQSPPIVRKPLPSTPCANYPPSKRPCPPAKSYPHLQLGLNGPHDSQLERLDARGSHLRFNQSPERTPGTRPAGPRQFHQNGGLVENGTNGVLPPHHDLPPPYPSYPTRDSSDSATSSLNSAHNEQEYTTRRSISPVRQSEASHSFAPTRETPQITLIRRDPASGGQWNIGTISQARSNNPGSKISAVSVELTTPGYLRFSNQPDAMCSTSAKSDLASMREAVESALNPISEQKTTCFSRIVDYKLQPIPRRTSLRRSRANSTEIAQMASESNPKPEKHILCFNSPWQGNCTFSNGADGRSLRCKHSIPSVNPGEVAMANVAELRFNLPWAVLGSRDPNRRLEVEPDKLPIPKLLETKKDSFRRSMQQFKHRSFDHRSRDESQSEDSANPISLQTAAVSADKDDAGRLSLRLGREKAGGGFNGRSAKLGKLVIDDEGLKMCDLVVAACMGIWWQHYEEKAN